MDLQRHTSDPVPPLRTLPRDVLRLDNSCGATEGHPSRNQGRDHHRGREHRQVRHNSGIDFLEDVHKNKLKRWITDRR